MYNIGLIEFARTLGAKDKKKRRSLVNSTLRGAGLGVSAGLIAGSAGGAYSGLKQSKGQGLLKRAGSVAKMAGKGGLGVALSDKLYDKALKYGAVAGAGTYLARRLLDKAQKKDSYKYEL